VSVRLVAKQRLRRSGRLRYGCQAPADRCVNRRRGLAASRRGPDAAPPRNAPAPVRYDRNVVQGFSPGTRGRWRRAAPAADLIAPRGGVSRCCLLRRAGCAAKPRRRARQWRRERRWLPALKGWTTKSVLKGWTTKSVRSRSDVAPTSLRRRNRGEVPHRGMTLVAYRYAGGRLPIANTFTSTTPAMKPPMCAMKATPPVDCGPCPMTPNALIN
jgi:hypothetical protein